MKRSLIVPFLLCAAAAHAQTPCTVTMTEDSATKVRVSVDCPRAATPTPAPTTSPTTPPTATPPPTPAPTPTPLPSIAKWESQMLVKGQKAWDELKAGIVQWKATGKIDPALGPTYYDMGKVFLLIADYTGDVKWLQAAADAFSVYRDGWVVPIGGGTSGYWGFSNGMMLDYKRQPAGSCTPSCANRDGIKGLATKAAYCADATPPEYTTWASLSRETAYCVLHYLNLAVVGGTPNVARRDWLATQMLSAMPVPGTFPVGHPSAGKPYPEGHMWQWINHTYKAPVPFDEQPRCAGLDYYQPFMGFLSMQSAIQLHAVTNDARVLPDVEALAKFTWDNFWDPTKKAFAYENCRSGPGGTYPAFNGAPDLNLLGASVWEWLYAKTGNAVYRQQGDLIFQGGVDGAYLDGAKQFNQNYIYSFDYVKLRKK